MNRKDNTVLDVKTVTERLAFVKDVPLSVGSHQPSGNGTPPAAFCLLEKHAYVTVQEWTDDPRETCCPVIAAYGRRVNDRASQELRDRIDAWWSTPENVVRIAATADDGLQEQRRWLAMDFAVREALPARLDAAKRTDDATRLRELPEITDRKSSDAAMVVVREIRTTLPDYWEWRRKLRAKYTEAVKAALKDKPVADADAAADVDVDVDVVAVVVAVAVAVAAADADADADAAADVDVDVDVDVVAVAVAVAAAVADADAAAAAAADVDVDADAAAVADADYWERRGKVYDAVYAVLRPKYDALYGGVSVDPVVLLERMVSLGRGEALAA